MALGGGFRRYYPETNMASESMFPSYSAWGGYQGRRGRQQDPYSAWGGAKPPGGYGELGFAPDWGYPSEQREEPGPWGKGDIYSPEPEKGRQREPVALDPRGPTPGGKKKDGGDTIININTNGGVRHEADQPIVGDGGRGEGGYGDYPVRHEADIPIDGTPPIQTEPGWYDPLRAWYEANDPGSPQIGGIGDSPGVGNRALQLALARGYSPFYGVDPERHQQFRDIFGTYQKAMPRIGSWSNLYSLLLGRAQPQTGMFGNVGTPEYWQQRRGQLGLPEYDLGELYRRWQIGQGGGGTPEENILGPYQYEAQM